MAPAHARPSSESYGKPSDIKSAPRLAYPRPNSRNLRVVSPISLLVLWELAVRALHSAYELDAA